jgi:hypothetical protein
MILEEIDRQNMIIDQNYLAEIAGSYAIVYRANERRIVYAASGEYDDITQISHVYELPIT